MTTQFNETRRLHERSIALGVEQFGLIPLRAPRFTLAVALTIAAFAVFGALRIKVDDSLSQLFRLNSSEFRGRQQVSKEFPSSEYDVMVVVSAQGFLERQSVGKLRTLATDLQLVSGARGIISMFSAEETRHVSGELTGTFEAGRFEGSVSGPGFTANIRTVAVKA